MMICGDAVCDNAIGENCQSCAADCATASPVCGNGVCDGSETTASCIDDCGPTPWPSAWAVVEAQMLDAINSHRATGATCPGDVMSRPPVGALARDPGLDALARNETWDFSHHGYRDPRCSGVDIFELMVAAGHGGFRGVARATIATVTAAVDFWMADVDVCPALMNPVYTITGCGHAADGANWYVAVFADR